MVEEVSSSDGVTGRGGRNSFPALFLFLTRRLRIDWSGKIPLVEMFLSQLGGVGEGGNDGGMGGGEACFCHNAGICVCL